MVEWTAGSILHTGRSKMWDGDMSAKQQGIQNLKVSRLCACLQTALVAGSVIALYTGVEYKMT